ncbi:unnamed protein product [Mytilus edulis]|uniref:BTB domain-containing protein n=1 Tax=Mytilus edulis TaxID=6550 RepID=A0A8S3TZS0_MYTED|nr:unnamed protein product [Mytilus edulis]
MKAPKQYRSFTFDDTPIKVQRMKSSFTEPDVAFIVEGEKIFTHRAELMKKSPVFNSMFSSNFMEKDKFEIELPGKNMHHFLMFLRCTLDGYGDDIEGLASKKVWRYFSTANGYDEIDKSTLNRIAMKRWEDNIDPKNGEPVPDSYHGPPPRLK